MEKIIKKMKVTLNQKIFTTNKYNQKQHNVAFGKNASSGLSEDSFKILNEEKKLFENILLEFSDRINLEKENNNIKIPNCIMFETKNESSELLPVSWLKKTADCNFITLTDRNNDDLADALWEELKKSKNIFEQTKRRTIIHVEGFDKLITPDKNTLENIDSIKDIMNRTSKDFGATIVFSTKDASKLTPEAIQPHRVTKIIVNSHKANLEKYNMFLENRGYFKNYETRIASKNADTSSKMIQTKIKEPETLTPQTEVIKNTEKPDTSPPQKLSPIKAKPEVKIDNSSISYKNETKIEPPKTPDISTSVKTITEKASNGTKTFKITAFFVALGAIIAGVIYFAKNKEKQENSTPIQTNNNIKQSESLAQFISKTK